MDIYAFQAMHVERPSLVDLLSWVWSETVRLVVALLRAVLHQQPDHQPTHRLGLPRVDPPARAESGADERYATELVQLAIQHREDHEFGLFCGPISDLYAFHVDMPTQPFTLTERLDARPSMPAMYVDATEVALTAAARQAGGVA